MRHKLAAVSNDILENAGEKRMYNRALFSIVAPQYHKATIALSFGRDSHWKRIMIAHLPYLKNGFITDLACGTGDITALLNKAYSECFVLGIDLSKEMLFLGQSRGNVRNGAVQDMGVLGLRDGSCEIVTGCYALRNAPDIDAALREVRRILTKNGTAAFLDFSRSENRFVAAIQHLLLNFWGSLWGIILHGNPAIYSYIAKSLRHFPPREKLHTRLFEAGLDIVRSKLFCGGMIELLVCRPLMDWDFTNINTEQVKA